MLDLADLTCLVEEYVNLEITQGFEHEAEENTITHNILVGIRRLFANQQIEGPGGILDIRCEAYKHRGQMEYEFGDIGILVNINYADNDTFEGAGFIEAKIRNRTDGRYREFKLGQIELIHANAPFSFVFPYDYAPIQEIWDNVDIPYRQFCRACNDDRWLQTRSIVIPTGIILRKERLNPAMYKYALPFPYQLCFRFLLGFDLNYAPYPLKSAKEYLENRPTRFVLTFSIGQGEVSAQEHTLLDDGMYEHVGEKVEHHGKRRNLKDHDMNS